MQRISVVGSSCSGKSTFARHMSEARGVPHIELDALHWGPDWSPATPEEMADRVRAATSGDAWVVDGNYQSLIGTLVWERADTVIWLNPPRWQVMARSLRRTLRRILTREELWNGNREDWRGLLLWRRERSILWWAWSSHRPVQERYRAAMAEPEHAHLAFHRLRSRREVDRFMATLESPT